MLLSALRWIAVLPSSLLAAVVVRLIAGLNDLSISMMGIDPDAFMPKLATSVAMGAAFAFVLGYVGAWIAPTGKAITGLILVCAWALIVLAGVGFIVAGIADWGNTPDPLAYVGDVIGTVVIATASLVAAWDGSSIFGGH